ncbi:MAG: hypothetical protein IVW57_01070 [Ktedonobacterales bacterium]|nr:hypothetical protein [Ktedonobacterales bacterium]
MDADELQQLTETLRRVARAMSTDPALARQVREALTTSGVLEAFGAGETLDVVELLDVGGEQALRARLTELPIAHLRQIIAARTYDPEKATTRWRSASKLIDLIVTRAASQLAAEQEAAASHPNALAASWML